MVIVRDLVSSAKKDSEKLWTEGLSRIPSTNIVILWETDEPKSLEKKPLFKSLKDVSEIHHYPFPLLEGAAVTRWTSERVRSAGGTIEPRALSLLVEMVSADLWQMNGEVEKLVAFADGKPVTEAMVRELVHATFEEQIFDLIDAVAQRRTDRAIQLLDEQRQAGAADGYILSMLIRQVRILLGVRAALDENPRATKDSLASELGIHPFVASKALAQARGFTRDALESAHDLLYKLDLGMKTSRYDDGLAVDLAVNALVK